MDHSYVAFEGALLGELPKADVTLIANTTFVLHMEVTPGFVFVHTSAVGTRILRS